MKDVGMSKPKKHANKVGRFNIGPKIKQTTSIYITLRKYCYKAKCCTYIGLYGSGLFPTSQHCSHAFWVLTSLHLSFLVKMKEDVGMSKPKKHVNKVRWDPQTTSI